MVKTKNHEFFEHFFEDIEKARKDKDNLGKAIRYAIVGIRCIYAIPTFIVMIALAIPVGVFLGSLSLVGFVISLIVRLAKHLKGDKK